MKCNCSPPNELSSFGRATRHASHYLECPMWKEPTEVQKANARKALAAYPQPEQETNA